MFSFHMAKMMIDNQWTKFTLLLLAAGALAVSLRYIFLHLLQWTLQQRNLVPSDFRLRKFFYPAFGLFLFFLFVALLFSFFDISNLVRDEFIKSFHVTFGLVITWNIAKILDLGFNILLHTYDVTIADNLGARRAQTQLQFIERLVLIFVWIIGIGLSLMAMESVRKLGGGLLASAGIVSVVMGFAAQKSLGNLLAGFQIAFTQPLRIDDVVVVEGEWGRIEEITLTYLVVRIWDLRRLIVPITYFTEKPFENWTRTSADIIGTVFLYMDYSVPVENIRQELTRLLESSQLWDGRVNKVHVTDSKERTVEVRALMSARNSSDAFDLRCLVREQLIAYLQTNYPQSLPRVRLEETGD